MNKQARAVITVFCCRGNVLSILLGAVKSYRHCPHTNTDKCVYIMIILGYLICCTNRCFNVLPETMLNYFWLKIERGRGEREGVSIYIYIIRLSNKNPFTIPPLSLSLSLSLPPPSSLSPPPPLPPPSLPPLSLPPLSLPPSLSPSLSLSL